MKKLIFAIISAAILSGCASSDDYTLRLEYSGQQKETSHSGKCPRGSVVVIALKANKTTGYEWSFDGDANGAPVLKFVAESYNVADNPGGLVGVGGKQEFTFIAEQVGDVMVKFKYSRPWEKDKMPEKEASFNVSVK